MKNHRRDLAGHWIITAALILIVAALSIQQADKYMPVGDAWFSMQASGWIASPAFSPTDVLDTLAAKAPNQAPFYFLLLNQWGHLVGHEVALARVFTVFTALLSFAIIYRLARDLVSPVAGNFAAVILASNAFYAYYFTYVRYYPMLVFLSALVLWLYLRIAVLKQSSRRSDYAALIVACAALVSTHAFGLLTYIFCSLYHLFFVRKNTRWLLIVGAAFAGLALAAPLIHVLFTKGVARLDALQGPSPESFWANFLAFFDVTTNGSLLLLLIAIAGAAVGWRRNNFAVRRGAILFALLLLSVALAAAMTWKLNASTMRYLLTGFPIAVMFQAAGLYALYRERKILAGLLCLWGIAGLSFFGSEDYWPYVDISKNSSRYLPSWHLVSRTVQHAGVPAQVIAYKVPDEMLYPNRYSPYTLVDHWFRRRNVEFRTVGARKWLAAYLEEHRDLHIAPWLAYQTSLVDDADLAALEATMDEFGFQACDQVSLPVFTEMVQYSWISLDCQPAQLSVSNQVEPLSYDFFGVDLAADGSRLFVANRWKAQSDQPLDQLRISHQLLSRDWHNVAQVDGPLKFEGDLRQYAMDINAVAPGHYRLVAIVYDRFTGVALDWHTPPGNPPSMLLLGEIEIR